jgi:hypothetical protein
MPYKDPEPKRQWEREHREQRNARRRALKLVVQPVVSPKAGLDPRPNDQPASGWKVLAGLVVGVGIILLGALAGTTLPHVTGEGGGSKLSFS